MNRPATNCKKMLITILIAQMLMRLAVQASSTQLKLSRNEYNTCQENINHDLYFETYDDPINNLTRILPAKFYTSAFFLALEMYNGTRNPKVSGFGRTVFQEFIRIKSSQMDSENCLLMNQRSEDEYNLYKRLVRLHILEFDSGVADQAITATAGEKLMSYSNKNKKSEVLYLEQTIILRVYLILVSMVMVIWLGIYTRVKKTTHERLENSSNTGAEEIGRTECFRFDFSTINVATKNFSNKNKIGQNAVGALYMGTLPNGQRVAVRKLNHSNSQWLLDYFKNEIFVAYKLLHRNLIKISGFSSNGEDRFLIYEFIPMNLADLLFDRTKNNGMSLNWEKRYKIIKGITSAVRYLHEDSGLAVANGDIRSSKVLLDQNFNPKILAFGAAKFLGESLSDKLSTEFAGIAEYLDPEYFKSGVITLMSDVYSFGVLLLEIISGQECRDHAESLINCASRSWSEGTALNFVDPRLIYGSMESRVIFRCIQIALLCARAEGDSRPTMASVFLMLNTDNYSLPMPINLSESESSEHVIEPNSSEPYSDSESLDIDSSDSFVSAQELPLSPTSQTGSSNSHVKEVFIKLCYGVFDKLRNSNFQEIGSICRRIVANANDKGDEQQAV